MELSPFQTQYDYVKSRAEGILNELQLGYHFSLVKTYLRSEQEIQDKTNLLNKFYFNIAFYNKDKKLMLEFEFFENKISDKDFSLSISLCQCEETKANIANMMLIRKIANSQNKTDFQNTTFKKESLDQSIKQNMDEFEQAAKTYLLPYLKGEVFVDHSPEILESYNEVTYNMQSELVFGKKKSLWQKISSLWKGH